jgi:hypothetical protein
MSPSYCTNQTAGVAGRLTTPVEFENPLYTTERILMDDYRMLYGESSTMAAVWKKWKRTGKVHESILPKTPSKNRWGMQSRGYGTQNSRKVYHKENSRGRVIYHLG